ncbi:MAG: PAS domain S-box protein, partial [Deltaproteobacteria bacterium]|nr:PAS domain S-box protein [Deltaproteobacteria bacterium]
MRGLKAMPDRDFTASQDVAALQFTIMDILENILRYSDHPGQMGTYLTRQIRELVGGRTVLLLQCLSTSGKPTHRLVSVTPERHYTRYKFEELEALARLCHGVEKCTLWESADAPSEVQILLRNMQSNAVIALPLRVGSNQVGVLLMLHLLEMHRTGDLLRLLDILAPVVGLILRNALLYETQEMEIQARTHELARREQHFRSLTQIAPVGIFQLDAAEQFIFTNDYWHQITGLDRMEMNQQEWLQTILSDDRSRVVKTWNEAQAAGQTFHSEYRILRPNGEVVWVIGEAVAEFEATGAVCGYIGTLTDITARKHAEQRMAQLAAIVQSSDDAIISKNLDGIIMSWNEGAERIYGYTASEVIGRPISILVPPGRVDELPRILGKIKSGRHVERYETVRCRKDGQSIHVSLTISPIRDAEGQIVAASTIGRDITDHKRAEDTLQKSERKYRDLFEESFDGLFMTSPAGRILEMNKKGVMMFGYDTKEDVLCLDLAKDVYADPLDRKRILAFINSVGTGEYEVAVKRKNGTTMLTHCALTAEKDEEGKVIRYRGIIRDVTERKRAEEALRESEQRYKEVFDNTSNCLFLLDMTEDGRFKFAGFNPAAEKAMGIPNSEASGKFVEDVFSEELAEAVIADYRRCMEAGKLCDYEQKLNLPVGPRYFHTTLIPVRNVAGRIYRLLEIARDITENKEAEQSLALMNLALNKVHDAAYLIDEYARFLYVNEESCRGLGYNRDELLGLSVADVDPDYPVGRWPAHWHDLKEHGSFTFEGRHRAKDGHIFPVEISANYFEYDGHGYNLALVRDIAERQRTAEALRESEERYRSIVSAMAEGICLQRASGEIIALNASAVQILGQPEDQLMGRTSDDLTGNCVQEDGSPFPGTMHPAMVSLRTGKPVHNKIMGVRRPDGVLSWISINSEPLWKSGEDKPYAAVTSFADITARKLAEERQEYLMRRLKAIWEIARMVDVSSRRLCDHILTETVAMTTSSYGFFGFLNEEETILTVHSWSNEVMSDCHVDYGPIEFPIAQAGLWGEAVRRKKVLIVNDYQSELPGKKGIPAGHVNLHRLLVVPIFNQSRILAFTAVANKADDYTEDDSQHISAFVTSALVILQKRQAEEELVRYRDHLEDLVRLRTSELSQANIRLQELDRLKSMFIASMSHELRTPLNTIIGFTGMTLHGLSGALNEEQEDNLARVYRSAMHLLNLITDVIDISKIEAGRISIYPEKLMLDELVAEAVEAVQPQLNEKRLTLEVEAPAGLAMVTDRKRLLQCLLNFLSNA